MASPEDLRAYEKMKGKVRDSVFHFILNNKDIRIALRISMFIPTICYCSMMQNWRDENCSVSSTAGYSVLS